MMMLIPIKKDEEQVQEQESESEKGEEEEQQQQQQFIIEIVHECVYDLSQIKVNTNAYQRALINVSAPHSFNSGRRRAVTDCEWLISIFHHYCLGLGLYWIFSKKPCPRYCIILTIPIIILHLRMISISATHCRES